MTQPPVYTTDKLLVVMQTPNQVLLQRFLAKFPPRFVYDETFLLPFSVASARLGEIINSAKQ